MCGPPPTQKKKVTRIGIILLHWLWRTGAEIFPKLPQETADISKTTRTGKIAERCSSRRTYTARPRPASLPLTSKSKCLLDGGAGGGGAGGEKQFFLRPLRLPEVPLAQQCDRAFPRPQPGLHGGSKGTAWQGRRHGGHREGHTYFSSHRNAVVPSRQTLLCNN